MNVGEGPMELPEGVTPTEAMQDFTKRAQNNIDQAARAHADAVRATVSEQQRAALRQAIAAVHAMQRKAR
jgi:hypothetical protein